MIRVIFRDNNCEIIKASDLERMIAMGKVAAFYREGGWVDVKRDPIRGKGGTYKGPERRQK
jgi:hypothetical protein